LPQKEHVTGVILAGGRSTRFGSNKLEARVDGVAMLHRVVAAMEEVVSEIHVSVGSSTEMSDIVKSTGCGIIEDEIQGIGPIGGLMTAMRRLDSEWILLVAGDMPHLTSDTLRGLISQLPSWEGDAIVAVDPEGRVHPLAGCYRSSVLPNVEQCVREKKFAMMTLISTLRNVRYVTFPSKTLRNMNRLEDMGTGSFT
jgi:molybdopterin-guanine dinucleotide biosynthesis protein A